MIHFDKWVFPDGEKHLPEWMKNVNNRQRGRLSYQFGKYAAALPYLKGRRTAIDVGSHIGLWAFHMAHDFQVVHCFEPMPEHQDCWKVNMEGLKNAVLHDCALGDKEGTVAIATRTVGSSGDTGVVPMAAGETPLRRLDDFSFHHVDFMKIDCEGYEALVLKGAEETLLRCKPVIVVEQKRDMSEIYGLPKLAAVHFLESLGARVRQEISGDYVMAW